MRRFADFPIWSRVGIACLLPLLAFTGFAAKDVVERRAESQAAAQAAALIEMVPAISGLVHELQRERAASVGFVSSNGQAMADTMRGQRLLTDKAIDAWRQLLARRDPAMLRSAFGDGLDKAQAGIAMLATTRTSIDALAITGSKVAEYFSATAIAPLVTMIETVGGVSTDARILRQSIAFSAFVQRKEFAGQERAAGMQGFTTGAFAADVYRVFVRLGALQDGRADIFTKYGTPEQVELMQSQAHGTAANEVARMRAIGVAAPFDPAALKQVSGVQWYEATTRNIDLLKPIEDHLASDLLTVADRVVEEASKTLQRDVILFVGLLIVTIVFVVVIALSITRPIAVLVATLNELANGESDAATLQGIRRRDEIGAISQAILRVRDASVESARRAHVADEERRRAQEQRERDERARQEQIEAQARAAQLRAAEEQCQAITALTEGLAKLADGDLTVRLNAGFTESYQRVKDDFNRMIGRLQETITQIASSTQEVSNAAGEISGSTTDLSQRTEEQAASLEQTSASM
jgi:methyl-accepting chemotaxis protein